MCVCVLLWTYSLGLAKAGQPVQTYIQQLCVDTGCSPEDQPEVMNDREGGERGSGISVLMARQDDDDDACMYMCIYMWCVCCVDVFTVNQ